jgi:hypothetical protein
MITPASRVYMSANGFKDDGRVRTSHAIQVGGRWGWVGVLLGLLLLLLLLLLLPTQPTLAPLHPGPASASSPPHPPQQGGGGPAGGRRRGADGQPPAAGGEAGARADRAAPAARAGRLQRARGAEDVRQHASRLCAALRGAPLGVWAGGRGRGRGRERLLGLLGARWCTH